MWGWKHSDQQRRKMGEKERRKEDEMEGRNDQGQRSVRRSVTDALIVIA